MLGHLESVKFVKNPNEDLFMLSLSTGIVVDEIEPDDDVCNTQAATYLNMGKNGVNICMQSNSRMVPLIAARAYRKNNFYRINPGAIGNIKLDEVKDVSPITNVAEEIMASPEFHGLLARICEINSISHNK